MSFGEMAEPLIDALVPAGAAPVDLLVLAFAMHDLQPGRATAVHLSQLCPGQPLAFSLCDQGAAAAFSGLRVFQAYAGTGSCRRALLLVVEQSTLHYEPAAPAVIPERHAAVGLLLDAAGPGALQPIRQHTAVAPERAAGLLADELRQLAPGHAQVSLIQGSGLAALVAREQLPAVIDELVTATAGQPGTGVWWELAGGLPRWSQQERLVVLAEYDPILGYLSICAADCSAGPAEASQQPPRLCTAGSRR
jgi:4-hydroxymandelate oxidase